MFGEMNQLTIQATRYPGNQPAPLRSVTEAARDRKVCALVMTGRSVKEVAEAFSITVNKVASILNEYQYDPAIQHLHGNYEAFARSQVLDAMSKIKNKPHEPEKAVKPRKASVVKVDNEDIFDALRRAMSACPSGKELSQLEYNEWRSAVDPEAPGTRTIRRRLGWQQAKEQAAAPRAFVLTPESAVEAGRVAVLEVPEYNYENVVDSY